MLVHGHQTDLNVLLSDLSLSTNDLTIIDYARQCQILVSGKRDRSTVLAAKRSVGAALKGDSSA